MTLWPALLTRRRLQAGAIATAKACALAIFLVTPEACRNQPTAPDPATATGLTINGTTTLAGVTQISQLHAVATYSDATTRDETSAATWTSSNAAVATAVSGLVTAKAAGSTDVSATFQGISAVTTVTVAVTVPSPTKLAIVGAANIVGLNQSLQLKAMVTFSDGTTQDQTSSAAWTSSNLAVATVAAGQVTSKTAGTTDVGATVQGLTATATITVVVPAATPVALTIAGPTNITGFNQMVQLKAILAFSDGTTQDQTSTATWSSSNPAVLTVAAGLVTSVSAGSASITASAGGLTTSASVLVAAPSSPVFTAVSMGTSAVTCGGSTLQKNGQAFYSEPGCTTNGGRGFNVAVIDPTGAVRDVRNFDTWYDIFGGGNGATAALVAYVNQQRNGDTLLIAVGDEAGLTLAPFQGNSCTEIQSQEAVYAMLEGLGAKKIRGYCYWDSYGLIAVKGVGAKAEELSNGSVVTLNYTIVPVAERRRRSR
jgi:hypothetical protein